MIRLKAIERKSGTNRAQIRQKSCFRKNITSNLAINKRN